MIHPVKLKKKVFNYPYRPPPPPKPGQRRQPEEVELEVKMMEENMERMALVNIEWVFCLSFKWKCLWIMTHGDKKMDSRFCQPSY